MATHRHRTSLRRLAAATLAVLCAVVVALSGAGVSIAQDEDLESIREERRQAQAQAAAAAEEVDAAQADLRQVTDALEAVQAQVNSQRSLVADAERQLAEADAALLDADDAVATLEVEIDSLQDQLSSRAISSFMNPDADSSPLLAAENVTEAVRMRSLVSDVLRSESDISESLRIVEEDLAIERANAVVLRDQAVDLRARLSDELGALEEAEADQAALTADAESRLDHELSELASIQALESDLASQEQTELDRQAEVQRLAEELAKKANPAATPPTGGTPPVITGSGEIVSVNGIRVHTSVADDVAAMLDASAAAGHNLSGGGYRDSAGQIAVRENNCGTSDYAIWEMPASQCRPPTARPGTSQHERGLAIDFTADGRLIRSRSTPAFQWLAANAASYGFYNLPSEPWHWSTTGR